VNQANLAPIQRQVEHNMHAGWTWCLLRPEQVRELVEAYQEAWRRLGAIHELAQRARVALADHHLGEEHSPCVQRFLEEIEQKAAL
jgi:hypothetical protein